MSGAVPLVYETSRYPETKTAMLSILLAQWFALA